MDINRQVPSGSGCNCCITSMAGLAMPGTSRISPIGAGVPSEQMPLPESVFMEPESLSHQLWNRARAGDAAAFEQLFALHTPRLLVLIRYRMSDRLRGVLEPEDILQEAYL